MTQEALTSVQPKEPVLAGPELDRSTEELITRVKNTLKETPEFVQAVSEQFLEANDPMGLSAVKFQRGNFLYKVECIKEASINVPGYLIEIAKYSAEDEKLLRSIAGLTLEGKVGYWWNRITFSDSTADGWPHYQNTATAVRKAEEFLAELKGV